jgi:hypothetical protein
VDNSATVPYVKALLLAVVVLVALALPISASAAERWAGLTRSQALTLAKRDLVAYYVTVDRITPAHAARIRRYLDRTPPRRVTRVRCFNKRQAWRIVWPKVDPVYVDYRGLVFAC